MRIKFRQHYYNQCILKHLPNRVGYTVWCFWITWALLGNSSPSPISETFQYHLFLSKSFPLSFIYLKIFYNDIEDLFRDHLSKKILRLYLFFQKLLLHQHETFRRCPRRLLNFLRTLKLASCVKSVFDWNAPSKWRNWSRKTVLFTGTYFPKDMTDTEAVIKRCSVKKVFFRYSQNSPKITCARVSFLIKLRASGLQLY